MKTLETIATFEENNNTFWFDRMEDGSYQILRNKRKLRVGLKRATGLQLFFKMAQENNCDMDFMDLSKENEINNNLYPNLI